MDGKWSKFESLDRHGLKTFLVESPRDRPMFIDLNSEVWGPIECEWIAEANVGSCLKTLSIRGTQIGDSGVLALLANDTLASTSLLMIERSGIDDFAVSQIAQSPHIKNVKNLCLGNRQGIETGPLNQVSDSGAIALSKSDSLPNLADLDLAFTDVGDIGFEALFTSPLLPKRLSVIAWGTQLTQAGKDRVMELVAEAGYKGWIHTDFDERTIEY